MANKFASPLALRYVEVPLCSGWLSFVRALTTMHVACAEEKSKKLTPFFSLGRELHHTFKCQE